MCGIAGVVSFTPLTEFDRRRVDDMNLSLAHRGPDSHGTFGNTGIHIGMRRLSIIDVNGGSQPFYNETGTVAAVCNGEIYNYVELRQDLAHKGHRFTSQSDVEVIVHLYEDMGVEFLKALRGMFAIALWDASKERVILARDRMGEKPLYWYQDPKGHLWFASEMKSLLHRTSMDKPRLSLSSVRLFFTYQYVPDPLTMFEGVHKLPPGHYIDVSPNQPIGSAQPYWDYLSLPAVDGDPILLVREELETACRIMGRSDVPVGIALSGGLDSAAVAALSAKTYPGTLQAFTVGYAGQHSIDERVRAGEIARHLGIPFHDVELTETDLVKDFPELVWAMDDPIADIAAYGYYAVSSLARDHGIPVLLSGLGGDEMFWGYGWIRDLVTKSSRWNWLSDLPPWFQWRERPANRTVQRLVLHKLHEDLETADKWARALLATNGCTPPLSDVPEESILYRPGASIHLPLSQLLNLTWLASNCLALADRVAMAHSVEMRLPLLDTRLVELVVGLRKGGMKDWTHGHKWLLVEAVRDVLPASLLDRPKQGFTPPVLAWYEAIDRQYTCLLDDGSLVRRDVIPKQHLRQFMQNAPLPARYKLVLLEVWYRLYVERETPQEVAEASTVSRWRANRATAA